MNVSLEKTDDVSSKLTVKLEKSDYEANVEKSLKKLKQRANMPGFRPGMVPIGLVKKMYGNEVKAEEVNNALSQAVNNYIKEQKLQLVADPLMSEDQSQLDIVNGENFEITFDLGVAPKVNIEMTENDALPYYDIEVDEKTIDDQISNYCRQAGKSVNVEAYEQEDDMLRGSLTELAEDGTEKDGGLKVEKVSLMPKYFSADDSKALFKDAKKESDVIFNLSQAYEGKDTEIASVLKINKEEVAQHSGDFKFHVEEVTRFQPAEVNQELFDMFFAKDKIKSETELRTQIKSDLETAYVRDSDYKFIMDIRTFAMDKVGELQFPESILKRYLINNLKKEEDKKNIDKILKDYIEELKWSLVRSQMAENLKIKIDEEALKKTACEMVKIQFSQYGINNIPDDTLNHYAEEMIKDEKQRENIVNRSIDAALADSLKKIVKLNHKKISIADFNKMFEPAEA